LTDTIFDDMKNFIITFAILVILTKLIFFNDTVLDVLIMISGFYWLFVIPGFLIMRSFNRLYSFNIRFLIGIAVGIVCYSVCSFYLGLLGVEVASHWFKLPLFFDIVGIGLYVLILPVATKNSQEPES